MKRLIKYSLLFFLSTYWLIGQSEGWKQLRPGNATQGQISWERDFWCSSSQLCAKDNKIHIRIKNTGEKIYYGFNDAMNFGPFDSGPYYVRMLDPDGNVMKADTLYSPASQGFIIDYAQASTGPNVLSPSGYWGLEYTPASPGDYMFDIGYLDPLLYAEFTNFDVTVIDTTVAPLRPIDGRVYCKTWIFNCAQNEGFIATMYGLPPDSIVTSIKFNGIRGNQLAVTLNHNGCFPPPADWITSRKSKVYITNWLPYPEYKLFLNDPDSLVYPTGILGMIIQNSLLVTPNCNGTVAINFQVNKSGIVEILVKINPLPGIQTDDVVISDSAYAGLNTISWNGLNGLGQPVANGIPFEVSIKYLNGLSNLPMRDVYSSSFGFIVQLYRPVGPIPLLYWDDREIDPAKYNLDGCLSSLPTSGCHTWSGSPYIFTNTINTWWYTSNGKVSSPAMLFKRFFTSVIDTTICAGDAVIWRGQSYSTPGIHTINYPSLLTGCDSSYSINILHLPTPVVHLGNDTTICTGQSVVFDAGACTGCTYQWSNLATGQMNIGTAQTYTATQAGIYLAIVTGPNGCKGRDTVTVSIGQPLTIGVSIAASNNTVCAGTQVTYTATPVNPGSSPAYQWKINTVNAINGNNAVFTYTPGNGDVVTCELTSSLASCISVNPVTSNAIMMTVNPNHPVSVSVSASATQVCEGTAVSFIATPSNGGSSPAYQWKVNAINVINATNAVFTYVPSNGDIVTCIVASSFTVCTTSNPATSAPVSITVNPNLPVGVSITPSSNPFCLGNPVTFTATPVNGGASPTYQWKVNGLNAGTNSPILTFLPANNDQIIVNCTSSIVNCTLNNPATSTPVTMIVNTSLPAGVSIAASANPFCSGTPVTFTATSVNGGTNPSYQWKVNAVNAINGNNAVYTYNPLPGDLVSCVMTSNLNCVTANPATSNIITMAARSNPTVIFTACFDTITTINAKPFKLKGGLPLDGTYSGPGVNSTTGIFTPGIAGPGNHQITYTYTNTHGCFSSKNSLIHSFTQSLITCGNNLTDIRDGKIYPTVQIGSQCWMQKNLEYGTTIPLNIPQTDNCIAERYIQNSIFVVQYSLFQWDEVMRYDPTPASQGLCPPGWHIPTSAEWDELLSFYQSPGMAGWPLMDTLLINGFHSVQDGFLYLNNTWAFTSGFYAGSMYWTSTLSGSSTPSGYRAVARGLNAYNPSVSRYEALRGNAFGVRCCRD